MKLEQQVVSLELAKRLKKLGVKQESLFFHVRISDTPDGRQDWLIRNSKWGEGAIEEYSAFTVAELGEMLPTLVKSNKETGEFADYHVTYQKLEGGSWIVGLDNLDFKAGVLKTFIDTEADARAKMLIYLIDNKLQTIKKGK